MPIWVLSKENILLRKLLAHLALGVVLVTGSLGLTACGSQQSAGTPATTQTASEAGYPVTVTTYDNDKQPVELTFDKAPKRVIAVYQNDIENLLALGQGDKIVMATGLDHDVLPNLKDAFGQINYTSEYTPSKESALSYEPDFILGWHSLFADDKLGSIKSWQAQGVNAYSSLNSGGAPDRTLENEYTDLENLGKIFGVEDRAKQIVDDIKSSVSDTVAHAEQQQTTPNVLVMESLNGKVSNYGASTLVGDMVTQLKGKLVAPDAKKLGAEDIVAANPDVIFVVYMDSTGENMAETVKANVMNDPAYADLDAVKNGRVVPIELGQMYCSGVRTVDGIHTLAKGMYPGINL